MIVTAWNNGRHHSSGAGYGLKIKVKDRDEYFNKDWKNVLLKLEGMDGNVIVNTDKKSFWYSDCRELIKKEIGIWLRRKIKAPWPKARPPKLNMEHISGNRFEIK